LDTILPADAPDVAPLTTLDYELYGPLASFLTSPLDSAPGSYDVFDGALTEFYDSYNALVGIVDGDLIPTTDLLGVADIALDDGTLTDAALFGSFFDTGVNELLAWFGAAFLA
jgi:hypothetical protein